MTRRIELVHGPEKPQDPAFAAALAKLDGIAKLKKGWDGYGGDPIRKEVVLTTWTLLTRMEDIGDCEAPSVSSAGNGRVCLQWERGNDWVGIDVGPTTFELGASFDKSITTFSCNGLGVQKWALNFGITMVRRFSHPEVLR